MNQKSIKKYSNFMYQKIGDVMDNEKKGKIIVIEGTDCSGKATQSK